MLVNSLRVCAEKSLSSLPKGTDFDSRNRWVDAYSQASGDKTFQIQGGVGLQDFVILRPSGDKNIPNPRAESDYAIFVLASGDKTF